MYRQVRLEDRYGRTAERPLGWWVNFRNPPHPDLEKHLGRLSYAELERRSSSLHPSDSGRHLNFQAAPMGSFNSEIDDPALPVYAWRIVVTWASVVQLIARIFLAT